MKRAMIAIDGASRGNPGPAGIGIVICDESGKVLKEISESIGETTNNIAEYQALIRGLEEALDTGVTHATVNTDSELLARHISGEYRVKNEGLVPLYESVLDLLGKFEEISVNHVTRDKNKEADKLASKAASGQKLLIPEEDVTLPVAKKREVAMVKQVSVKTSTRTDFLDITREVQNVVKSSGVSDGVCLVYVPHTTAGVTINENADPDVTRDIIDTLERLIPRNASYRHREGNADSHVKASLMGFSVNVIVENGRLVLGTWQGIYFCEFDGPRNRKVYVRVG